MMGASLLFPAVVVAAGVGLLLWAAYSGQHAGEEHETGFHRRQWRRRAATAMLTITLGVGLYAIQLVRPKDHPTAAAALWILLLFGVLALFGLAGADALASSGYLARMRNRQQATRLALEAELRRMRSQLQGSSPPSDANGGVQDRTSHSNGKHASDAAQPP